MIINFLPVKNLLMLLLVSAISTYTYGKYNGKKNQIENHYKKTRQKRPVGKL